jgi:hypothetical protein
MEWLTFSLKSILLRQELDKRPTESDLKSLIKDKVDFFSIIDLDIYFNNIFLIKCSSSMDSIFNGKQVCFMSACFNSSYKKGHKHILP